MALPEYFDRNAQAAAALIQGFDATALASLLEKEVIGIVVDAGVEKSPEARCAVDLTLRLLSRLYPALAISGTPGVSPTYLASLSALALAINPKIDLSSKQTSTTKLLVFGNTAVKVPARAKNHAWYVGSDNWVARLSRLAPVGSGISTNPLGAGAAACVAAANVFRAVFVSELGDATLDSELSFSLLTMRQATGKQDNLALGQVQLEDVHLVGAGAIGNGALWALSRMPCQGSFHIVDHEKVSDSNLQRYVMLTAADRDAEKATLAGSWFSAEGLTVTAHVSNWAAHIATIPEYKVSTVLSAVDTANARIQIQASLPHTIYNAWTQRGEAGVSRHHFLGKMACLACLYLPRTTGTNEDVLVLRALRLPEDEPTRQEVRRRLQKQEPTDRAFLESIALAANLPIDKLLSFENRPLRDLYVEGVCGGRVMEFHQAALQVKAEVPMGFQSALAGILLAAELARPTPLLHTITQIDLLGTFPEQPGRAQAKTELPPCLCLDEDFIDIFREKYSTAGSAGVTQTSEIAKHWQDG